MDGQNRPSVSLAQGRVLGKQILDGLPRPVDAFLGIPYALPPTGDRRFRPPVKVPPSSDATIDAVAFGKTAPGKATLVKAPAPIFGEDCLTANVFRQSSLKSTGSSDSSNLVPVLVYIHGGCYNRGSASMHNTASMVAHSERPFVAVSFNYRLGALGFLPSRLSAKEGALNLGLRDQILLLEWVRDNITAFGGDPARVTLYGLSAGAHSVSTYIHILQKRDRH
jgi:carboxylesterase type B